MMKKLVLVLAVVLVLSGIFAVAALTQVEINRDIEARVASDTDDNVAVKFTVGAGYGNVASVDGTSGEISFDLGGALTGTGDSFNTEALFTIGDDTNWVFSITNNTLEDITIEVVALNGGGVELWSGGSQWDSATEVTEGEEIEFYFILDTFGVLTDGTPVDAEYELQIRLAN